MCTEIDLRVVGSNYTSYGKVSKDFIEIGNEHGDTILIPMELVIPVADSMMSMYVHSEPGESVSYQA